MEILENKTNMVILENNNTFYLVSYKTTVASYNNITKQLNLNAIYWDYSQTTLKQVKYFINNYTCYYYESKKDFEISMENVNKLQYVENM